MMKRREWIESDPA